MIRGFLRSVSILLLCLCLPLSAFTESAPAGDAPREDPARDLTQTVFLNGQEGLNQLRDNDYGTTFCPAVRDGTCSLTIEAPEDETLGHLLIKWLGQPVDITVESWNEKVGDWELYRRCESKFYAQYVPLRGQRKIRFYPTAERKSQMNLVDLRVMSPGTLPDDFQVWQEPAGKVDLMLVTAHPDDEVLWFGGLLPYYAAVRQKNVVLVDLIPCVRRRRLELLDCLWSMGVRVHPVFGHWPDVNSSNLKDVYKQVRKSEVCSFLTEQVRIYKPDVLVLHDVNGEYGHAMHKLACVAGQAAYADAADAGKYLAQVQKYGTWQVKKCYIHLYPKNQVHMDWHVPSEALGGRTPQEAAREGFTYHRSQLTGHRPWAVLDGGIHDNALFGLYASEVGEDVRGDDLLENIDLSWEPSVRLSGDPFECTEE